MEYAIATGHSVSSDAAELIIRAGGNIWDAAIAAHWAMCISEPCMASLGGAGLAMIATERGKIEQLDFFCQTPAQYRKSSEDLVDILVDFGSTEEHYYAGHASIAIPGTVAGLFAIHERYGSIPMQALVQPAIQFCKEGVTLNSFQRYDLDLLIEIQKLDLYLKGQFINDQGEIVAQDSVTRNPDLADTLDFLSREGVKAFYEGEIAQAFMACHAHKGHCTRDDFKRYKARWSPAYSINYQEHSIFMPTRPSLGGYLLDAFLNEYKKAIGPSTDKWSQSFLKLREIRSDVWSFVDRMDKQKPYNPFTRGTSHFTIMDERGNAIALTSTIGEGAGVVIPETGVHLNNMLGEEALMPGGLNTWIPDQRLDSMTTPVIVQNKHKQTEVAIGSAGAKRIPFVIAQCLDQILEGADIQSAIDHPRIYDDGEIIQIEPGINLSPTHVEVNSWGNQNLFFGGVQGAQLIKQHLSAGADKRRLGDARIIRS